MQQLSETNIANNLHVQKIIVLFEKNGWEKFHQTG